MKKTKRTKKRTPPTPEQLLKREKSAFKRKIRNTFTGAGFNYVPTNDKEMNIGLRKIEIDSLFIFENIWLVCEDTVATSNIRDHIRTKNEALGANCTVYFTVLLRVRKFRKIRTTTDFVGVLCVVACYGVSSRFTPF